METWYLLLTRVEYISYNERRHAMDTKKYKLAGCLIILFNPWILLLMMFEKLCSRKS